MRFDYAGQAQKRYILFSFLLFLTLAFMTLNICTGSVDISLSEIFNIIFKFDAESTKGFIVWKIRIPRALSATLGGAFLAVSGLLLQVFFRNPIVGPFILGISSGATLMVGIVMLTAVGMGFPDLNPFLATLAAFLGAYGTMSIVIGVAAKVKSGVTLLIVGLMMGYLCHAVTSVIIAFAEAEKLKGFTLWQLGSFSGFKWSEIEILFLLGGPVIILSFCLSKPLNAFLLGEDYAATMGVNIRIFRILILFCACFLAGMVTSVSGPVAFIGLAVPHMVRLFFASSDNRILIPGVILSGGAITCLCDLVARSIFSPVELPISAVTALFGAPVVIRLLMKRRVSV